MRYLKSIILVCFVTVLSVAGANAKHAKSTLPPFLIGQLLINAAEVGDIDIARKLIELGAHASPVENGWSALHFASLRQDTEMWNLLNTAVPSVVSTVYEQTPGKFSFAEAALLGAEMYGKTLDDTSEFLSFLKRKGVDVRNAHYSRDIWAWAKKLGHDHNEEMMEILGEKPKNTRTRYNNVLVPKLDMYLKMSKQKWKVVQKQLTKMGMYGGKIDGVAGRGTKKAVASYFIAYFEELERVAKAACAAGLESRQNGYKCFTNLGDPQCNSGKCKTTYIVYRGGNMVAEVKYFHGNSDVIAMQLYGGKPEDRIIHGITLGDGKQTIRGVPTSYDKIHKRKMLTLLGGIDKQ